MNDEVTARLALPLLQPGQAQKEMTHNEALARIDLLVGASVVAAGLDSPPATPAEGECWIVGDAPAGAWAGQARALAGWTAGGWRFVAPVAGLAVWNRAAGVSLRWTGAAWVAGELSGVRVTIGGEQVVGARQPAIAAPAGGGTVDAEARAAIAAMLSALRTHGLIAG